ncbi:MAG TPA: cyclic nucleotide-binding domain-containing protein [Anaerolineae bacterium]|nr:cyclic nucleotide-binding domain-containing protein [Anaerolineae bacterium]HMR63436.1 cyclic nucleotide-binding domain-containing protein [Anaerolineae bacterium]
MATIGIFKYEAETKSFPAGEVIFQKGDPGDVMYVIQEGEVQIVYRDQILDTVGPGGVVGEMALVNKSPRSAAAIAKTDCTVVPLDEEAFKRHVHHTPFFAIQVMRVLADRLRRMNETL